MAGLDGLECLGGVEFGAAQEAEGRLEFRNLLFAEPPPLQA